MQFNVAQLLKDPVGASRHYLLDEAVSPFPEVELHWVKGQARFLRTNRSILVVAALETSVTCSCSRCLESYLQPLSISLEEEFLPTVDVATGAPAPAEEDQDGSFTIDRNHTLDLLEAVRQYAIASLPMKPLCQSDCPGICPQCGANRKDQSCRCASRSGRSSLGPLLNLRSQADTEQES